MLIRRRRCLKSNDLVLPKVRLPYDPVSDVRRLGVKVPPTSQVTPLSLPGPPAESLFSNPIEPLARKNRLIDTLPSNVQLLRELLRAPLSLLNTVRLLEILQDVRVNFRPLDKLEDRSNPLPEPALLLPPGPSPTVSENDVLDLKSAHEPKWCRNLGLIL